MSISRPVPEEALPALLALRTISRPLYLPSQLSDGHLCFWDTDTHKPTSPLGLHPLRRCQWPRAWHDLPLPDISTSAIEAFNTWWDEQTDGHAALNEVWAPSWTPSLPRA